MKKVMPIPVNLPSGQGFPTPNPIDGRKCCYLEGGLAGGKRCGADAEWRLYGSNHPKEPLDACTKHVGHLMDDSSVTYIYPIERG